MSIFRLFYSSWLPRITPWWWITCGFLLVSPFLPIVVPCSGIVLATLATSSGRKNWHLRLAAAPLLVIAVQMANVPISYGCGYLAARNAVARGEEQSFRQQSLAGSWCSFDTNTMFLKLAYEARKDGVRAGLPPNAGKER